MNDFSKYRHVLQIMRAPAAVWELACGMRSFNWSGLSPIVRAGGTDGFPPALIPIVFHFEDFYGYWKHWFIPRTETLVWTFFDARWEVYEVARTFEQLLCYLALQLVCRGNSEAQVQDMLALANIEHYIFSISEIANKSGEDPHGLLEIDLFAGKVPLQSCRSYYEREERLDLYTGEFPNNASDLMRTCGFELTADALAVARTSPGCPPWLLETKRRIVDVFDERLDAGDFGGAWLALNSGCWDEGARDAIERLAGVANEERFRVLADAWLGAMPRNFGY